jgi:hypothetical protein
MSIFDDVADQWQIADDALSVLEQAAFAANDDQMFDIAMEQRSKNDQAYFLYLFTRFEDAVNKAALVVIGNRTSATSWADRRIWVAWSARGVETVPFLSKVEVLIDKSLRDYGLIKGYYDGRNDIAHGGIWSEQFVIPVIARTLESISASFPTS